MFHPDPTNPDFASLKSTLAQARKAEPSLVQTIKLLIDRLTKLKTNYESNFEKFDNSINDIMTVINIVADKLRTYVTITDETLKLPNSFKLVAGNDIALDIATANQVIINLEALETILTKDDETVTLPNSIRLLAGTNITFDDAVPNQRTINATGGSGGAIIPVSLGGGVPIEWMCADDDGAPLLIEFDGA